MNVLEHIWKETRKIKNSLANKVPIPRFTTMLFEPNLLMSSLMTAATGLLTVVSGGSLFLYVRSFSTDWTQSWKAASVSLGFLLLSLYMLNRWGHSIGGNNYLELERDIVLQNLSVEEIRTTFVKQLIGLDASQWLDGLLTEFKTSNEELEQFYESGGKRLLEIQGIEATYLAERLSRANILIKELDNQVEKYKLRFGQFTFRLDLFYDGYLGPKERQASDHWRLKFSKMADDSVRILKDVRKLQSEIQTMVQNHHDAH